MARGTDSERVAIAFDDWLKAEVVTSGEGRNKYLDATAEDPEKAQKKFDDMRRRLVLPFDDDENWQIQKHKSHVQQRVPTWIDVFGTTVDTPKADYYAGQAAFAPKMTTSGSYRVQCYIQAKGPEEYSQLRSRTIGIDIEEAVMSRLQERQAIGGFTGADISFDGLRKIYIASYAQTEQAFKDMIERMQREGISEDEKVSLSVNDMKKSQFTHIQLATDCLIMAAKLRRGQLEAVPFLEPVSITDQSGQTHYPLRERVDWALVLSS